MKTTLTVLLAVDVPAALAAFLAGGEGRNAAAAALIFRFSPIVLTHIKRAARATPALVRRYRDELYQEGCLAVLKACEAWDGRGALASHVYRCVGWRFGEFRCAIGRAGRRAARIMAAVISRPPPVERLIVVWDAAGWTRIQDKAHDLLPVHRAIIENLVAGERLTRAEMAKAFGFDQTQFNNQRLIALKRLRKLCA